MITISYNNKFFNLQANTTLGHFLKKKKLPNYFAVSINKRVVSKSEFNKIELQNNDYVEIIVAVGGG
jgi:thiamine biosynthesis protein ThiS